MCAWLKTYNENYDFPNFKTVFISPLQPPSLPTAVWEISPQEQPGTTAGGAAVWSPRIHQVEAAWTCVELLDKCGIFGIFFRLLKLLPKSPMFYKMKISKVTWKLEDEKTEEVALSHSFDNWLSNLWTLIGEMRFG